MKKILIIRFSSIGDIVLTTPVVRCLKKQSDVQLHFLTKRAYLPLVEANPFLDKVLTIENKVGEILPTLKLERYDYIIDLHKNLRSIQLRLALNVKTYSFNKLNFKKWLLVNTRINLLPKMHIVERYFGAVRHLNVNNDGGGLDYFFPNGFEENWSQNKPAHPTDYIAFAIGAAHQTKRLPTNKIIEICQKSPLPIVLLGGKQEAKEGEEIKHQSGSKVINYCGQLTLHEAAKVIKEAHKVITHDTGMMHIAAAFGKEILSIWGSTVPEFGMSPYLSKSSQAFQVKDLSCRPCSKIGFNKCPKGHFKCMMDQNTNDICEILSKRSFL